MPSCTSTTRANGLQIVCASPDRDDANDEDESVGLDYSAQVVGAEECFSAAGLRWMRNLELGFVALLNDRVVGATLWRTYDAERLGSVDDTLPRPSLSRVYDFDIAVHPEFQGGAIGYLLMQSNIREARALECAGIQLWVINPVASAMLVKLFGFKIDREGGAPTVENPSAIRYSAYLSRWF